MAQLKCPDGYEDTIAKSNYCYKFYSIETKTPTDADSQCYGTGSLVTFESKEMLDLIKKAAVKKRLIETVWVGYRRASGIQLLRGN